MGAGRYGFEALRAFLAGEGKPVEDLVAEDFERFCLGLRQRVKTGELKPGKGKVILQGARYYLRFLARTGRLKGDERAIFFELYPHPSAVKPELLSPQAQRLWQESECVLAGVSAHQGAQYRRGAIMLLLFLEDDAHGQKIEDLDEGQWLAFRRHVLGEEAQLSSTALRNDLRSTWLTGARAYLRQQAERGRLRPEQVPLRVMPIEATKRPPRGGLPRGALRLLRFMARRGKTLEALTAADFLSFREEIEAERPALLEGVRAYLRQEARKQPFELDLIPLLAPRSFDEQRALYLARDPSLAPLFMEAEDFARSRRAEGYRGDVEIGAFRLLLFLRRTGMEVESLTAHDWHAYASSVNHDTHFIEAGRAYARFKVGDGALPKREQKPFYPELPQGLLHLPRLLDDAMRVSDLAPLTRRSYRYALRDLFLWLGAEGITDFEAVTRDVLTDYRLQLQTKASKKGTPYAATTQSGQLVGLRFFFGWLMKSGHLLFDPTRHLPHPRRPQTLPRTLKPAEIGKLLGSLPKTPTGLRDKALIELLYGTGIRRSEVAHLTLEDLDLEARTVLVREGKGRKDRLLPLGRKAKEALLDYLDLSRGQLLRGRPTSALFLSFKGLPLSAACVTSVVHTLGKRVKLKLWPHLLRHTCATHLLKGRADIRHIQRLLGHKSLQTTERYTRVEVGDLRRVIERCHPREKAR